MTVIRNNSIIYTVSVLIMSMVACFIFLITGTRRVVPIKIFLSKDLAPVSEMIIVSSTSSICSSSLCWCCVRGLLTGWN